MVFRVLVCQKFPKKSLFTLLRELACSDEAAIAPSQPLAPLLRGGRNFETNLLNPFTIFSTIRNASLKCWSNFLPPPNIIDIYVIEIVSKA